MSQFHVRGTVLLVFVVCLVGIAFVSARIEEARYPRAAPRPAVGSLRPDSSEAISYVGEYRDGTPLVLHIYLAMNDPEKSEVAFRKYAQRCIDRAERDNEFIWVVLHLSMNNAKPPKNLFTAHYGMDWDAIESIIAEVEYNPKSDETSYMRYRPTKLKRRYVPHDGR